MKMCKGRQEQRNAHPGSTMHVLFSYTHQAFIKFDYIVGTKAAYLIQKIKLKTLDKLIK